jgi:hypothetical protein
MYSSEVPRGELSHSDVTLIDELAARRVRVSPYQLERWRSAGLLPSSIRHGLGRGSGSVSCYPPEALPLAMVLGSWTGQGKSLHAAAVALFMYRFPVSENALRNALVWVIDTAERRAPSVDQNGRKAVDRCVRRLLSRSPFALPGH